MRYNAFFGELPLDAFKPIGGKMSLHGGGNPISAVTDAVDNVVSGVGDIGQSAINATADAGRWIDQTVRQEIPGGWTGAALIAAGAYYAPEIGAWLDSNGAVVAGSEGVAPEAGATGAGFTGEMPAGYTGYTAPDVTTLGNVAGPTEGMASGTSVADMGGAQGLQGGGYGNVADMGGGQGLYGVSPAGTSVSEMGGGLANGGIGAGIGSTIGAGTGAAAGNSLAGMLPYMTAAQVGTGLIGANAAKQAANIQSAAAQGATALQGQMFNTINQQEAPYRATGYGSLNNINAMSNGPYTQYDASGNPVGTAQGSGYLTHQFDKNDLTNGLSPNYDFMLGQGQMANQRAANAGGGALGGNALQGLNKYTQDYAGNAYQNAFTNYQNQRSNIYNTLAGIAGIGQTGQTATNAAGTNATNAASQLGVGSAAAQAAGATGTANAFANTANNVVNNYTLASLLNQGGRVA
jgi:hypothetical protein